MGKLLPMFLWVCFLGTGACSSGKAVSRTAAVPDVGFCSGDLVFRYGDGLFSPFFRDFGGKGNPYSHVGVIVLDSGTLNVVHAEAEEWSGRGGVRTDPLEDFLKGVRVWGLYRLRASPGKREGVARTARRYARRKLPFDTAFDCRDSTAVYCSELVMRAVNAGCYSFLIRPRTVRHGRAFVSLNDITDCPSLENVYRSF